MTPSSPTQDEEIKHILGHCLHPRGDEKNCIFWQIIGAAYRSKDEDKNRKIFESMQEAALHRLMLKGRLEARIDELEGLPREGVIGMSGFRYDVVSDNELSIQIAKLRDQLNSQIESPNDPS